MAKTKANRKGHLVIEKRPTGFIYRIMASNGRETSRESEIVKSIASILKSIYNDVEVLNGSYPIRVKLIGCKLPAKHKDNFVEV